jgi:hypothetical protein
MHCSDTPFIPQNNVVMILVDKRIPKEMEYQLQNRNIDIIKTCECRETYEAIKYHPDICVCYLGKGNIVIAPNVYDYYVEVLKEYNFNIIKGKEYIKNRYPYNVQYNVAMLGKYAIHNFQYTEKNILDYINNNKMIRINVRQGYSKCSICIVDENSIITSDAGIYSEVIKHDINCLLIEEGSINLFNMNHGFIGGCSGLIAKDTICFCGDITKHPNYMEIKKFLDERNKKVICLSNDTLLDLGSIIPLMTRREW